MRFGRLQSLFRDRSIVLRVLLIALVVSVLLLLSKASWFQTAAIAQIPMQPVPSNPCSALAQRDFAAIRPAAMQLLSEQDQSFLTRCKPGIAVREALTMPQTLSG